MTKPLARKIYISRDMYLHDEDDHYDKMKDHYRDQECQFEGYLFTPNDFEAAIKETITTALVRENASGFQLSPGLVFMQIWPQLRKRLIGE